MAKSIVFMFSGQGSQYYGMGRELYDYHAVFRKWMDELDLTFRELTGKSVIARLYDRAKSPKEPFDTLLYTHAAIFMTEYALAQVLIDRGIRPDYVLGSSMGEFASGATAGVIGAEDALRCLVEQVKALDRSCEPGGMLAILHDPGLYKEWHMLQEQTELASVNFHSHFVVSARPEALERIQRELAGKGIAFQRLPVPHAFHSSLIEPAAAACRDYLRTIPIRDPLTGYVSCLTGSVLTRIPPSYYWDVVRAPIDFRSALDSLPEGSRYHYVDLGPSGTLAAFAKYNRDPRNPPESSTIMTPYGNESKRLDALYEALA
ncbi:MULTISPECIES: acyltransferase domain-containing protein [Paenibacillus]|uniref:acyltransferase domain-containing protein n=1 Tax=Paenibacillus TaxID=44249 RepID=UPI0022B8D64D|nr:acyltransferase domain-containing protein [Paenibacillus caseinilyticus]MCZ8521613.1 acyltransferase domain-containing protein [Paenibacillus caseinilyticus]